MPRLLIADDHPIIISGIETLTRGTDYVVVGTAADGNVALDEVSRLRPDILILDLHMPKLSGLDVLRSLRSRGDAIPIVLLTASLNDASLLEAVELGANGIVLKESAPSMLLRCLEEVSQQRRSIDRELLERALTLMMKRSSESFESSQSLSAREKSVVDLVARGHSNREIANELRITEGTVKFYLSQLYQRLGVDNRTALAFWARQQDAL